MEHAVSYFNISETTEEDRLKMKADFTCTRIPTFADTDKRFISKVWIEGSHFFHFIKIQSLIR